MSDNLCIISQPVIIQTTMKIFLKFLLIKGTHVHKGHFDSSHSHDYFIQSTHECVRFIFLIFRTRYHTL